MTYSSVVQELDGLIDSLDEHVTIEDVGLALGELRANVFEMAKFEKAHTSADDEREALAQIVCLALEHRDGGRECEVDYVVADAILDAGFRRSEVPEPSACLNCGRDFTDGEPRARYVGRGSVHSVSCSMQGEPSEDGHPTAHCEHGTMLTYQCADCPDPAPRGWRSAPTETEPDRIVSNHTWPKIGRSN